MGLDTTHGCFHGAYSAFGRWRDKLAEVAGLPPLDLMEGYFDWKGIYKPNIPETTAQRLPIKWDALRPDPPLHFLLFHSDCDGEIPPEMCGPLADRLAELLPLMPDESGGGHLWNYRGVTQIFIDGLRLAAAAGETVEFH